MTFLRWSLYQTTLMVTINFMQGVISPVTYIEKKHLTYLITVVVELIFIFSWKLKVDFKSKNTAKTYLSYVLMGIGVCMFQKIIFVLFPLGMDFYKQVGPEGIPDMLDEANNSFTMIYICIAAPILEEILFRGKILNELLKKYKPAYCIVIAAFLFGLTHMALIKFGTAFCLGLLCGVVYVKTKDIKAPIIIHLANNTYPMIVSPMIMSLQKESFGTYTAIVFRMVIHIALGFVLLLLGLYIFYKEKIRNTQNSDT